MGLINQTRSALVVPHPKTKVPFVLAGDDLSEDMAAPVPAIVVTSTTSPCRPSLPDDLVRLVASTLLSGDLLDYVRFRAVCTQWRSATASPRGRGVVDPSVHPRRWMMFPEDEGLYPGATPS
jgi:hypothetical protein